MYNILKESENDKFKVAGWKTGDLRVFNYENALL